MHELLGQVPLFAGLAPDARARLALRLERRELEPGSVLFREGDPGGSLALVLDGEVEVSTTLQGREQVLAVVGPGGHVGEVSLLDGQPRSATVRARTATRIMSLSSPAVLAELEASPAVAQAMLGELARRLRRATTQIGEHVARNALLEVEDRRTWGERLADRMALVNGSWSFIGAVLGVTTLWVAANAALNASAFDPYPYVLYNLVLGLALSLQGPLIMMSQNRQAGRDRAQAAADYDVNLKNEVGIQELRQRMGRLEAAIDSIATRPPMTPPR